MFLNGSSFVFWATLGLRKASEEGQQVLGGVKAAKSRYHSVNARNTPKYLHVPQSVLTLLFGLKCRHFLEHTFLLLSPAKEL